MRRTIAAVLLLLALAGCRQSGAPAPEPGTPPLAERVS